MNLNILVTSGLYDTQGAYTAVRFCEAANAAGHTIEQVFFYQGGVTQATQLASSLADEVDMLERWLSLSTQTGCSLLVCISAAERRGIINQQQQGELAKTSFNLHPGFSVAGLGALHEASLGADRTVSFK